MNLPRVAIGKLISNWKITVPVIAAVGGLAYAIHAFIKKMYPQSAAGKTGKRNRRALTNKKVVSKSQMQSATDGVVDSIMAKVLTRCQFRIGHVKAEESMGLITMLGEGIGFMPMHFAQILTAAFEDKDSNPCLLPAMNPDWSQKREVPFEAFNWYEPEREVENSSDIVFFFLDTNFLEPTPNITKYFVQQKNLPSEKFQGALYCPRIVTKKSLIMMKEPTMILPNMETVYNDPFCSQDSFVLVDAFKYYLKTKTGDCGSLLLKYSHDGSPERILGMHVAGNGYGTGYSQSLSLELISMMYEAVKNDHPCYIKDVETLEVKEIPDVKIQGFTNLGEIPGPRMPTTSDIIPSPLNNKEYPCVKSVAALKMFVNSEGNIVDPIEKSREVYQSPSVYVSEEILEPCCEATINHIFNNSLVNENICGPRKLSFEEACFGIDGQDYCNGVKRSTSAGFPRCMEKPNKNPGTKRKWLGPVSDEVDRPNEDDTDYLSVKTSVAKIIKDAEEGKRNLHFATDFPKSERRSKEKVSKGLTRAISGTSMDYLIACIIEFGALCEWLMVNRIYNGMTIGINAFGSEWQVLAKHMKMNDPNVQNYLDGDFKAFDGSHSRQLLMSFHKLADRFYGNESISRRVLFEDLVNSIHISSGKVYLWNKSLPSGHFLTPMINCWINLILHRMAFVLSCRRYPTGGPLKNVGHCMDLYNEHVVTVVYGDDNFHYVGEFVAPMFNMVDHTQSLLELGYVYTDAQKSGTLRKTFLKYTEVSFLKRMFSKHSALKVIVAPLSLETITDMIQWTKKKDVDLFDLRKNVEKAILELSFHDFAVYKANKEIIMRMSQKYLNWAPNSLSYQLDALKNASREEFL